MKHYLSTILLFSLILLVACAQSNITISTPTKLMPTATLDLGTPTATEGIRIGITVIPPATWSPTPTVPTRTPIPTLTPTIRPATKTPNPGVQKTEQADEWAATQIASFPATCNNSYSNVNSISPSGDKMASSCGYKKDQTLEIVSHEGKKWELHFKDYLSAEFIRDGGTPMGGLYPKHWTSNDEYLYFTSYIAFDGGGTCFYGFGVSGLYRLNVNTGFVSTVLTARSSPEGYLIAFSPGGGKLAYVADRLVILDFRTGENTNIDPGATIAGDLAWSPDGTKLAFATCSPSEDFYTIQKSGIKIYSLETHKLKTIMEVENNFLSINRSEGNQKLKIVNTDEQTGKEGYFYFDWSTGQVTTPLPTP